MQITTNNVPRLLVDATDTDKAFNYTHVGCYLDGAMGWHNTYRVIDMAAEHGMTLDELDREAIGEYEFRRDICDATVFDIVSELADKATDYLQSITEPGLIWLWDMGELCLVEDDGNDDD